jgi:hypothetical protein
MRKGVVPPVFHQRIFHATDINIFAHFINCFAGEAQSNGHAVRDRAGHLMTKVLLSSSGLLAMESPRNR